MAVVLGEDKNRVADDAEQSASSVIRMGRNAMNAAKKASTMSKKLQAAKSAEDAVRTGATAVKVGTNLAAGNVAGAAAEAAKDPKNIGKILLAIVAPVLCVAMLITILMHSIPIAIYEQITSFVDDINTTWEEIEVSNRYGAAWMSRFAGWVGELTGVIEPYGDFDESDYEHESKMMYSEGFQKMAILHRICVVNEKIRTRAMELKEAVEAASTTDKINTYLKENSHVQIGKTDIWERPKVSIDLDEQLEFLEASNSITKQKQNFEKLKAKADLYPSGDEATTQAIKEWEDDFAEAIYDESEEDGLFPPDTCSNALRILTLLTVQKNASIYNISAIDLMKSLGWYTSNNNTVSGLLGNVVEYDVKEWVGTFRPQYLEEEIKTIQEALQKEEQKANADDEEKTSLEQALEEYESIGVPLVDLLLALESPDFQVVSNANNIEKTTHTTTSTTLGVWHHFYYTYRNPNVGNGKLVLHEKYFVRNSHADDEEPEPIIHYYQYEVTCFIACRDISELNDTIGLWSGTFEDALEEAAS